MSQRLYGPDARERRPKLSKDSSSLRASLLVAWVATLAMVAFVASGGFIYAIFLAGSVLGLLCALLILALTPFVAAEALRSRLPRFADAGLGGLIAGAALGAGVASVCDALLEGWRHRGLIDVASPWTEILLLFAATFVGSMLGSRLKRTVAIVSLVIGCVLIFLALLSTLF